MALLICLDIPLLLLGLFAVSPWLWSAFHCRPRSTTTALLFYLGLGTLGAGSLDTGLAAWDIAHRPRVYSEIRESMMAPDFTLPSLDEDRAVRLSDFRGQKPVVLVFGNFY